MVGRSELLAVYPLLYVVWADAELSASELALVRERTAGWTWLSDAGRAARRQTVRLGRASSAAIEVLDGLAPGDRIIVSDMSRWDRFDRVVLH